VSSGSKLAALAGRFSDAEGLMALKDMINQLGSETVCVEEPFPHVGASYVSHSSRFRGHSVSVSSSVESIFAATIYSMDRLSVLNTRI
jgi:hypothetical protein